MKYGEVAGVGKPISRICQGMMMVDSGKLDYSFRLLDAAFELGINAFDSAHVYGGGRTDVAFGKWVKARGVRDQVVLIEKGAHHGPDRNRVTPEDIRADLFACLERLDFDYVDFFLLHRDDPDVPVGPIVEALTEQLRAGRIRAFGGSNWRHERIAEANRYAKEHGLVPFAASSPHFSLAEMVVEPWKNCVSITGATGEPARRWYSELGFPLFIWSSLARGFLSGRFDRAAMEARSAGDPDIAVRCFRSPANLERLDRAHRLAAEKGVSVPQIAAAYALNYPLNIFALIGAMDAEECRANVAALDLHLTEAEMAWLDLRAE